MEKENILLKKSYEFSLKIILLGRVLNDKKEFILAKQILKSGTSIGANAEEAICGQSEKDFFTKLCIAYKEARETHYWLRLLGDAGILEEKTLLPLLQDCQELLKIIGKIQSTLRKKLKIED
ncbi:four helix bundle protein [Candidatus Gracilibacteria bacterium]|nr:four helix bundle protein [Candidatus Gracilibacteria bacterium]MCF7819534.1 four helix bundle protein [Candidatus Gracilibacteria bacterium]